MKKAFPYIVTLIFAGFLIFACDDTITGDEIDKKIIPAENVSYQEYIQPVFTVKCAMSGCHDDRTQSAGLVLTSWGFATANYAMVAPGNPTSSKIVWAIKGNGAKLMPPMYGTTKGMTANQVAGIETWIREGAKNN